MKSPFATLLDKYRKISLSQKEKGERFEHLMQAFLRTYPKYSDQFKKVLVME